VGLLTYFIEQMSDPAEKARSWQRYHIIRAFVESAKCRNRQICVHFGETPKWISCNACDVCIGELAWLGAPGATNRKSLPAELVIAKQSSRYAAKSRTNEAAQEAGNSLEFDALYGHLREWRRALSKELNTPAFIVMHDTTLAQLCRLKPATMFQLRQVPGFGDRKVELYGERVLDALESFGKRARGATR
jgi:superfamily II DNA helicase RecQ